MSGQHTPVRRHIPLGFTLSLAVLALPATGADLFVAKPLVKDQRPESGSPVECPMSPTDQEANQRMQLEGKCGEGKCGAINLQEGKCGEGKCGATIKRQAGRC